MCICENVVWFRLGFGFTLDIPCDNGLNRKKKSLKNKEFNRCVEIYVLQNYFYSLFENVFLFTIFRTQISKLEKVITLKIWEKETFRFYAL